MTMHILPPPSHDPAEPERRATLIRRRRGTARRLAAGAVLTLAGLIGIGAWTHAENRAAAIAARDAIRDAVPIIRTVAARPVTGTRGIDLPADLQAFDSATLHARATGYIDRRMVDIGSRVRAGDVLATIAAPDLDQQLTQATAQLAQMQAALRQAEANAALSRVTDARTSRLVRDGWSSQQEGDNTRLTVAADTAGVAAARANLVAQLANVNRLRELTGFERITAPFDGVITSRRVDVGNLVTADASSGTPLFTISRTDKLRVQVYVPQAYFFALKNGATAEVTVPQLPGRAFRGVVARNANALATDTRTVLTEVDIDNTEGVLAPGLYGIVHFAVPRQEAVVIIPANAVIFDANGLGAAVDRDGRVELRHLDVAEDNGAEVEVRGGLRAGDAVILDPPVNVVDGMRVRTAESERLASDGAGRPGG
ncbi:MAG TPA: efflux RND transporter periplasmic adaptor subunit [Acetobacteraceae bacterium]|nr:efflux RND transporter periplasmic adaptor subunit [Acetobacteraceae bacterium]